MTCLIGLLSAELARSLRALTNLPCLVQQYSEECEPDALPSLTFSTDLSGDVDIELTLFAEESSIEELARGAGFDEANLDVRDSGLELLTTLAGHMADQMETLDLREEVVPHRAPEPLGARRPFDRRVLFNVRVGAQVMLLEALLRLQTLA